MRGAWLTRFLQLPWGMVVLIMAVVGLGIAVLYSAGQGWSPWAGKQALRFALGFALMLGIACSDLRFWMRQAYPFYILSFLLLVAVEMMGHVGMGAQRWIDVGFMYLQPSEVMKVALIMALARYFQEFQGRHLKAKDYVVPLLLVAAPAILVLRQPDLGTAVLLVFGGFILFFMAGLPWWTVGLGVGSLAGLSPILWSHLHDYQKKRILTFLNPEGDPLGAGYHIVQSKIALGSGGLWGKGFGAGSQSYLNFLPEKQTDFIFAMLCEELGLMGGACLILLYTALVVMGHAIASSSQNLFGRYMATGMISLFFFYAFINMAMVMGMVPVVGVPLPLVSYGGTAMLTLLMGFGLIMCVGLNRHVRLGRATGFI